MRWSLLNVEKFDQRDFRQQVLIYYNATKTEKGNALTYCHVTGWQMAADIKAGHLVPKWLRNSIM
jgi:hypothetical protein